MPLSVQEQELPKETQVSLSLLRFDHTSLTALKELPAALLSRGDILGALSHPQLIPIVKWALKTPADDKNDNYPDNKWNAVVVGAALLLGFMRENWGGPTMMDRGDECCEVERLLVEVDDERGCIDLEVDGESVSGGIKYGVMLHGARRCFVEGKGVDVVGGWWWLLRVFLAWDYVVDVRGPCIEKGLRETVGMVGEGLAGLAEVEVAIAWRRLGEGDEAERALERAGELVGVKVELTGALGVRTKWQEKEISQLRVDVSRIVGKEDGGAGFADFFLGNVDCEREEEAVKRKRPPLPRDVALNDTDLLGYVKYGEETSNKEQEATKSHIDLNPIEQAVVLAHTSVIRGRNASHKLTDEEISPYVSRILQARSGPFGSNSALQLRALLLRAHIERERGRYMERSMTQLETINDFVNDKMEETSKRDRNLIAAERVALIFASSLPHKWNLKKELAISFGRIGLVKAAMQIFRELEYWDELVDCHRLIGNLGVAEKIVREQLEILEQGSTDEVVKRKKISRTRKSRLLCVLGDITRDVKWYGKAWQESGSRFARAKRSLGRVAFDRQEWKNAAQHFQEALAMNPLHADIWFYLGCCGLELEDRKMAAEAFTRVVQQSPTNGQAWNNLGRVLADSGKPKEAMAALGEAAKLKRESWQIWNNLLTVAATVKAPLQIISAQEMLVDLKGKEHIRPNTLLVALKTIIDMARSEKEDERRVAGKLCKRLVQLLGRITTLVSSIPAIWRAYAELYESIPLDHGPRKAVECRQKQLRALTSGGEWSSEYEQFERVAAAASSLAQDTISYADQGARGSAKMQIANLLSRSKEAFEGRPAYSILEAAHRKLSD